MRQPNGYGGIRKLSGNRRKPYHARILIGYKSNDVTMKTLPVYKTIGYYPTKKEALMALADYNRDPTRYDASLLTFKEVYDRWFESKKADITDRTIIQYKSTAKHFEPLYGRKFAELKTIDYENVINPDTVPRTVRGACKAMLSMLYDYAMRYEICSKNYATVVDFKTDKTVRINRSLYTREELDALWAVKDMSIAAMVITGIYTGFRPGELRIIKKADVHDGIIVGGLKTDSGRDRHVPIHKAIAGLIEEYMQKPGEYLFMNGEIPFSTGMQDFRFKALMKDLQLEHKQHDHRHTFATYAKRSGMDEYVVKKIMGHKIEDITAGVYTHYDDDLLKREIKKYTL